VDDASNNRSKILSLYRSIRRIHETSLPTNLRDIGNKYLQSEFRTLKDTTKMTSKHFQNFMSEWEKYRQQLLQSQKESKFGKPLPTDVQLTAEQQEQLRKLHQEVTSANVDHTNTDTDNKLG
jgi:putative lipoic acid-binding regulatory protein